MGWASQLQGYMTGSTGRSAAGSAYADLQKSKDEAIGYLNPWAKAGGTAAAPLTGLLTGNSYDYSTGATTALDQNQRNDLFQTSPGYQFRLDEAMKALTKNQNANGYSNSGGAQKEIAQYSQGIASSEYGNYINQLFQLAGMGEQADMAKANVTTNLAAPMANAKYSQGIAGNQFIGQLFNAAAAGAGAYAGGAGGGAGGAAAGGAAGGGGGTYNPSYLNAAAGV